MMQGEPWCLCFSSDNRVLKVAPQLVQSIAPLPTVPDPTSDTLLRNTVALETISQRVAVLADAPPSAWARADAAMWSLDGTVAMAKAALQLSEEAPALAFGRVDVPAGLQEAIAEQRTRLSDAKKELRALSRTATGSASGARKAASGAAKAARLLEEAKELRAELDASLNTTWAGFEAVVGVLQDAGTLLVLCYWPQQPLCRGTGSRDAAVPAPGACGQAAQRRQRTLDGDRVFTRRGAGVVGAVSLDGDAHSSIRR